MLLTRLPDNAKMLFLVDVDGLLDSTLGQIESWRDEKASQPAGILGVPGDISKAVVASFRPSILREDFAA